MEKFLNKEQMKEFLNNEQVKEFLCKTEGCIDFKYTSHNLESVELTDYCQICAYKLYSKYKKEMIMYEQYVPSKSVTSPVIDLKVCNITSNNPDTQLTIEHIIFCEFDLLSDTKTLTLNFDYLEKFLDILPSFLSINFIREKLKNYTIPKGVYVNKNKSYTILYKNTEISNNNIITIIQIEYR